MRVGLVSAVTHFAFTLDLHTANSYRMCNSHLRIISSLGNGGIYVIFTEALATQPCP